MHIEPLHEIQDTDKVAALAESMTADGWQGRQVLALDCGDYLQAITGTHRLAAAEDAGIDAPVYIIEQPAFAGDYEQAELFAELIEGRDEDRLKALKTLVERGDVEPEALTIMQQETC